jgi:PEP-CTERM motif
MRKYLLCIAAIVAIVGCTAAVQAASSLAYSFESPEVMPDGFFGLGATTTQDTIGATVGTYSLKYAVGNDGFVGARTETVIPAALGNPPGVDYVLFDMYVPEEYSGTFADVGVTVFGHALNHDPALFGLQAQFADLVSIAGKAVGQYTDLRIDLDSATNPVTFNSGETFNQIFGPGADQLTAASGFQFFISKNGNVPVTVYIDNVRLVGVPEPATGTLFGLAATAIGIVVRRRR